MRNVALLVLVIACVHEYAWQLLPTGYGLQGNFRNVTQWFLVCSLLWAFYRSARSRFVAAVCAAVAIMSSTTAGCSAWWLYARFEIIPGQVQCSKVWWSPMMTLSCIAALAVFWWWREGTENE